MPKSSRVQPIGSALNPTSSIDTTQRKTSDSITSKLGSKRSFPSSILSANTYQPPAKKLVDSAPQQKVIRTAKGLVGRQTSVQDRFINGLYFLCPDCSWIQCSAIICGLISAAILTLILLYIGGFWYNAHDADKQPSPSVGYK